MDTIVPQVRTRKYYFSLLGALIVVAVVKILDPGSIPFSLFQFWFIKIDLGALQGIPWFLILIGPILAILVSVLTRNNRYENIQILASYTEDLKTSVLAGVFEEIGFRWLTFFLTIIFFTFLGNASKWPLVATIMDNWVWVVIGLIVGNVCGYFLYSWLKNKLGGCVFKLLVLVVLVVDLVCVVVLGWTWIKFIYGWLVPFVDWLTGGAMHGPLTEYGWAVGAAMVSVNWTFGKGHVYQGLLGMVDSWIFGMLMFWVTFNFGLFAAIAIHAAYDIIILTIQATDSYTELAIGRPLRRR